MIALNYFRFIFQIYLRMFDRPDDFNPVKQNGEVNLSAVELKKLKKKQNKEKAREAMEAAARQKQHNQKKVRIFVKTKIYRKFYRNYGNYKFFKTHETLI